MSLPVELVLVVRGAGACCTYRFTGDVRVGSAADCDVRVPDPTVRPEHLRLRRAGAVWRAEGRPLADGDTLAVGACRVDVLYERGGGLTTDSRDTERLAQALRQRLVDEPPSSSAPSWSLTEVVAAGAIGASLLAAAAALWWG